MVKVESCDVPEDEYDILEYLSSDSDEEDIDKLHKKFAEIEPLATLDETFPSTIIVLGIPKVGEDKYDRLLLVLQKKISEELQKKGSEAGVDSFTIDMPINEEKKTNGFCFLTFPSAFEAQHAAKVLSGFLLDAKHKFNVVNMDEFDEIVSRDESYRPPIKLLGFTREDFRWWLDDERQREQFVIRRLDETEICWHDPIVKSMILEYDGCRAKGEKRVWTDFKVQWSPQGSYLVTFHRPGVALWAGPMFDKKVRFEHKDVKQIEFSPNEEYLITWDGSPASLQNERAVRVWRVITGELLRTFPTPAQTPRGGEFPHFIWSHDDSFVARCSEKELCVYELPSMTLTIGPNGKRSTLKYPLKKFDWSPADNILSVWLPPGKESPGRLLLVEMPSRAELSSRNVYNVTEASMHWQCKGDYLCLRCVLERRTGKKGKKEYTQLEIFRMREKNIPVDTVHIEDITVKQLHWEEGYSKRFAIIVEDELTRAQSVRFYRVSEAGAIRDTVMVASYDMNSFMNFMKWAPGGSNFILAAKGPEGILLFCTLNENDKVDILHKDEHFMVNEIKWSSCGRYVATIVSVPMIGSAVNSSWRNESEAGVAVWTFQGRLQYNCKMEKLYQFLWRPHPPPLLPDKKIEEIKKNLKEYSKKYDVADEKLRLKKKDELDKQRQAAAEEFQIILDELEDWKKSNDEYEEWEELWKIFDSQFEWDEKVEYIEEELDVKEEIIG